MSNIETNKINFFTLTLATFIIATAFFVYPATAQAALQLPQTACGDAHKDAIFNGQSAHSSPGSLLENGNMAFSYGSNNKFVLENDFVGTLTIQTIDTQVADELMFTIIPHFEPVSQSNVVLYALDAECNVVSNFRHDFGGLLHPGKNFLFYDTRTYRTYFNGITIASGPFQIPKYLWVEVWDGIAGSEYASYSYLVDIENPQNPTGQVDETVPEPATRNPVLIVPGILGTELFVDGEFIWLDGLRMLFDVNDEFLTEKLGLNSIGNSINNVEVGDIVRRVKVSPFIDVDIFEGLVSSLVEKSYEEANDLFIFSYDWRLDLDSDREELRNKIEAIKGITGKQKVDVIAHSLGGIVVKNYIHEFGGNSIDKLLFVGTPHLGAPKSAKILLYGDRFGIPWLEEDRMKELSLNSPSVYQLLPNETYFNNFNGYIAPYKFFGIKLLDYVDTNEFLLGKDLNGLLLDRAVELHNRDLDFSGIDVYNIAGCSISTQAAYRQSIFGNLGGIGYTSGDGTVPLVSADFIDVQSQNKFYVKKAAHSELPSTSGVRELILDILNESISLENNVSNNSSFCNFKGKKLSWHSPVEVHIYDSFGNHTGPIEGGIENSIPGVDYEIIDEEKFIYLPTDEGQVYTIEAKGLEQGTFDLLISEDNNGITGKTYVFDNVAITPATQVNFNITDISQDDQIQIDVLGNNDLQPYVADLELENDEQLNDTTPPEFLINFDLEEGKIVFTATDNTDTGPTVTCTNTLCVAEDWAGNTTSINFNYRNLGGQHKLDLKTIIYNNEIQQDIKGNLVVHHIKKRNALKAFAQTFYKEHNKFTRVNYNTRKDESIITKHNNGISRKVEKGITILQLITWEGKIESNINL